jgi:SsrA-binding protein
VSPKRTDDTDAARRPIATNREARFRYEILDRWEAGIVLTGSEVKSARRGEVNLREAHVRIEGGEAWLVGCHVSPYENAGYAQHDPLRARKLLLHATELHRITRAIAEKGLAVVPLGMYFSGPRVKVEIAVGRGKKLHDKRETVKRRDQEREARRTRQG